MSDQQPAGRAGLSEELLKEKELAEAKAVFERHGLNPPEVKSKRGTQKKKRDMKADEKSVVTGKSVKTTRTKSGAIIRSVNEDERRYCPP